MKKVKVLSFVCLGLLAINIYLIWFLVAHKPPHNRQDRPKKIIIERLHFNKQQIEEYEKLIDAHRRAVRQSEQQMMELKNQLYATLVAGNQNVSSDSLVIEIGKVQVAIEHVHYKHFQDIKLLCKPEQIESFNELSTDIAQLFAKPMPPNEKR